MQCLLRCAPHPCIHSTFCKEMNKREFNTNLKNLGFQRVKHPLGYDACWEKQSDGKPIFIIRDSVRGGNWRLFLGYGAIPCVEKDSYSPGEQALEAESPWFEYYSDKDIEEMKAYGEDVVGISSNEALEKCWDWLKDKGLKWLDDPYKTGHSESVLNYEIELKVNGCPIQVQRPARLP